MIKISNKQKSILAFVFLFIFSIFLFTDNALAKPLDLGTKEGGLLRNAIKNSGYDENTSKTSLAAILGSVVGMLISFAGVIFLALTVYAGFLWMTARGNDSQIEKSKGMILSAMIGLFITLAAYSITAFVVPAILDKTAGEGTSALNCCVYTDTDGVNQTLIVDSVESCTGACVGSGRTVEQCDGNAVMAPVRSESECQ